MTREKKGILLSYGAYILSLLIFGTNGLYVSKLTLSGGQTVLLRTLIGSVFLTGLVLLRGGFDRESVRAERLPLLLGGAALGLNWVALFEAYRMLNVSLATLIYYVGPILVLLLSPVLFHERLSGRKLVSAAVVAAGLLCISGSVAGSGLHGLLAAGLSALFYAALIVFNKKIVRTDGLRTAALELDAAFAVVLVYVLCTDGLPTVPAGELPYIAGLGLINTGLAYLLYFTGLQRLSGQSAALISYLDPVSALLFSALLLHEAMTPVQLLGAILILGGAILGELRLRHQS